MDLFSLHIDADKEKDNLTFQQIAYVLVFIWLFFLMLLGSSNTDFMPLAVFLFIITLLIASRTFSAYREPRMPKISIESNSRETVVQGIAALLNEAEESVVISSGSLRDNVWSDDRIIAALNRAKEENESTMFSILIEDHPKFDSNSNIYKWIHTLLSEKPNRLKFYLYDGKSAPHFVVVDRVHTRLEKSHENDDEHSYDGKFVKWSSILADRAESKFNYLTRDSKRLNLDEFVHMVDSNN